MRGGSDVSGATLSRFYGIHVAILPAITTVLLGVHLLLVQRHGMSVPPAEENKPHRAMRFFPDFLLRDAVGWLAAVGVLAVLAAFFPWELGVKADPFAPAPAGIRPEWYFLWMFQGLKYIPATVLGIPGEMLGIFFLGALALVLVAVPLLDRKASRWWSRAAWLVLAGAALLTVLALLPVKGVK
jgi:quinol-cytochrome oxidoreductase complex cytochrome b subunit